MSKSKLSEVKLHYELMENDPGVLMMKISEFTKTLKVKATSNGWIAQVRPVIKRKRTEIAITANDPTVALEKLDNEIEKRGLYEDKG